MGTVPSPIPPGLCQCGCGAHTHLCRDNDARRGFVKGHPHRFLPGHYARTRQVDPAVVADTNPGGLCWCGCGGHTTIATSSTVKDGRIKGRPVRYLPGHNGSRRGEAGSLPYVAQDMGYVTPCWLYQGTIAPAGYGMVPESWYAGRSAHRYSYEQHVGAIPPGLEIDHLCRVRRCVNPTHLEAVTPATNIRRGQRTKLTPEQVAEIRAGSLPVMRAARHYGVTREMIRRIRRGLSWREE